MTSTLRAPAADQSRQRLRLRRFLLASSFSLVYLLVLAVFHKEGGTDSTTLLQATGLVATFILAFLLLFVTGLNLRAGDPSLTAFQMATAVATMLFVFYRAPETRLVFGAFFFVTLTFGLLRSGGVKLTVLGAASLAGFAAVSTARYVNGGSHDVFRMDMLQLVALAVSLPWFVFIGSLAKRLRDADRRKDAFLATVAHELRNPLGPVRTGVRVLRMGASGAKAEALLPMMERQIGNMSRLLDDLLDISRITSGRTDLLVEQVELRHVVDAAVEVAAPMIEEMRHCLTVTLPSTPVMLNADPLRLTQILSNLLTNAAKYTPPEGRIELDARCDGRWVEMSVRDNGIGIPRENLGTIFEMYTRVATGNAGHASGLGIGLALVQELARLHGGSIEARSEGVGRGSEFRLRLPVVAEDAGAGDRTGRPEAMPFR